MWCEPQGETFPKVMAMGLISNLIAYNLGKRVGRSPDAEYAHDTECVHYSECVSEGGCAHRACEYEEE